MRNLSRTLAVASALVLCACVTTGNTINLNDAQSVRTAIEIKRDGFQKMTTFVGPNATRSYGDLLTIRAWKIDGSTDVNFQIYVRDLYDESNWRNYFTAYDSDGKAISLTPVSSNVLGCTRSYCTYMEHVGLNVTREYLEKKRETGLRFKLTGQAGEQVFSLPGGYISAILDAAK